MKVCEPQATVNSLQTFHNSTGIHGCLEPCPREYLYDICMAV